MSLSLTTTSPYTAALAHNREVLRGETEEAHTILQRTIQAQKAGSEAMRDENALLRAQLEQAERRAAQAEAALQAERVASAAMARENASLRAELVQLRKCDAMLQRIMTRFSELEALRRETWPELNISNADLWMWDGDPQMQALWCDLYDCKREKVRWESLIAEIQRMRPQVASPNLNRPNGPVRSNTIPNIS